MFFGAAILLGLALPQNAPIPPAPPRIVADTTPQRPETPAEFRSVISSASREKIVIRALDGGEIPVDISGYQLWDYRLFSNGRYFGTRVSGYETTGYLLVDRAAPNDPITITGKPPLFSPDGRWFAVAGLTDADQGNFEGIGVWEVTPSRTVRRFFTNAVPLSSDWSADRWIGNCVVVSAINSDRVRKENEERDQYSLWIEPSVSRLASSSGAPCDEGKRF